MLVVTRLDRLARSTRDLLNVLGAVADKQSAFKSLRDTWAATCPYRKVKFSNIDDAVRREQRWR